MKKALLVAAAMSLAAPAFAGSPEVFVAPPEPVMEEAPAGGSNAAIIVPILALVIAGVAIANSN
jgi:hypothetical protein